MISKNQIKFIKQLELKKYRQREGLFVAEGPKVVGDLMTRYRPTAVYATDDYTPPSAAEVQRISDDELRKVSFLQHPQQVVALFPLPSHQMLPSSVSTTELTLALDGVQDPGNLGTIIRIADWFGINRIVCSEETADAWNPKVVQATMGSIARVRITYVDLPHLITQLPPETPVYGTLLDGTDLYASDIFPNGLLVMGNEGNGISAPVEALVTHRLLIPPFPAGRATADSLNVAIATAICSSEFRRRQRHL